MIMFSCSQDVIYDQTIEVKSASWEKNELARFDCEIEDTLTNYRFILNLRHNIDYKYSNLFLFMNTTYPNGNKGRDTIEIIMAEKSGKWLGSGWGEIKDLSVPLIENIRFPLKGNYTFQLQQAMRIDTLSGIENIGIRIEKTE